MSAELCDPATGIWTYTGGIQRRSETAATAFGSRPWIESVILVVRLKQIL